MYGHLIAIKVGVKGCTDQRMNTNGFAFHEHGFKSLNPKTVESWGPVEQDGILPDDFIQRIPDLRPILFHHFLGAFNRIDVALLL